MPKKVRVRKVDPKLKKRKGRGSGKAPPVLVLSGRPAEMNVVAVQTAQSGKRGAPHIVFTQELGDEICRRISLGGTLHRLGDDLPGYDWIVRARRDNENFALAYARAIQDRSEYWAAEIHEIADTTQVGEKIEWSEASGEKIIRADMLEHRRLRIEARKWLMAKASPRTYGDKLDLNIGGQPENPIALGITFADPDPVSENEEVGTDAEKTDAS